MRQIKTPLSLWYWLNIAGLSAFLPIAVHADTLNAVEPAWRPTAENWSNQSSKRLIWNAKNEIIAAISSYHLYPDRNTGIQCQEVNATLQDVSGQKVFAQGRNGERLQRFGGADSNGKRVLKLQLNAHDLVKDGAPSRCELVIYPTPESSLPEGSTFWYSMNFLLNDWTGSTDEQIITQMHADDPRRIILNPFIAVVVKGNLMRTEVRWNLDAEPSKERTQIRTSVANTVPMQSWINLTIRARISTETKDDPFVTVWLNDQIVTHHQGPIGYKNPRKHLNFVKAGIYHWANGNPWDISVPNRYMLLGSMALVADPQGKHSLPEMRKLMDELMR